MVVEPSRAAAVRMIERFMVVPLVESLVANEKCKSGAKLSFLRFLLVNGCLANRPV